MQQAAASPTISTFAATLASLAAPQKSGPHWNDDGLEDDVAVFSYELALQGRVQTRGDSSLIAPTQDERETPLFGDSRLSITEVDEPEPRVQDRKRASVTIRLSVAECAQLRARAAESGMTVSAYLRSCTLEVESLRAQVKEVLAQLRPELRAEMKPAPIPESNSEMKSEQKKDVVRADSESDYTRSHWFARIWPRSRAASQAA